MIAIDRRRAPAILGMWLAACLLAERGHAATPEQPLTELPYSPSLDLSSMDPSVDPCVDLFHYACGGWIRKNPIPPDKATWSVYAKMEDENARLMREKGTLSAEVHRLKHELRRVPGASEASEVPLLIWTLGEKC